MITAALPDQRKRTNGTFKKILISLFCLITAAGLVASTSSAQELSLNEERVFAYATFLYHQGEYYRAISEYKRLLYFFPASHLAQPARLQIGRSYMAGNSLEDAVAYWNHQLEQTAEQPADFQRIRILLGISLLDLNQTEPYRFREKNIKQAFDILNGLDSGQPETDPFIDFTGEWQNRKIVDKRSPWLAGGLSAVVPGAGSFYTGRYLEGTYAFFLTGLFYLATRDAVNHNSDELGILFGFLTVSFYGGGIYTAINGVHKLNDKLEAEELLRIREKYGVWFIPATENHPGRY